MGEECCVHVECMAASLWEDMRGGWSEVQWKVKSGYTNAKLV